MGTDRGRGEPRAVTHRVIRATRPLTREWLTKSTARWPRLDGDETVASGLLI